ncbi:MAG: peptide chain release factor N(5)-glutamine methyltransferase [Limisphaerales bacterium]
MTYAQLLKETSAELERLGVPNYEQEAWWILASSTGRENFRLAAELPLPVSVLVEEKVETIVQQRRSGQPLVYITGETDFYGLRFKVSPAVLIPRSETETLVAEVLKQLSQIVDRRYPFLILDVGTGSGCIALALLSQLPHARALATDISKGALRLAAENAREKELSQRIQFVLGNLLEPIKADERFDVLVSNPPYIDPSEMGSLDPSVRRFEPNLAIESQKGGTWFHRQIARLGAARLRRGGILAFEVGNRQAGIVACLIKRTGFYEKPQIFSDLFGYERVVLARKN